MVRLPQRGGGVARRRLSGWRVTFLHWISERQVLKKRWRNAGLYVLLVIVFIALGTAFLDRPNPANAPRTLRYSDFVEAVQQNEVSRVLIAPDRGTAQVVENDGQRAQVNLAPDKDLLTLLTCLLYTSDAADE